MIKEIDKETFFQIKPNKKKDLFLADVREILARRIEFCELEEYPYSKNTPLNDVIRYARVYLYQQFFKETGKRPKVDDMPFVMTKYTDNNNEIHVCCAFYVNAWDRMISDAKEEDE